MRLLVTGGAGYIGSHAVRLFLEHGHDVWVYDNLSFGHAAAVPGDRLVVADLAERERLIAVLREKKIEAVVHFAAFAYVGESVEHPFKYYRNNVANTLILLEAMQACQVQKLVFSSTCATYGTPFEIPITEATPQQPINPYGRTKLMIEWALADAAHAYGLGYAALRYFNAAGAHPDGDIGEDHSPESHLIPLILQTVLGQRQAIHVFGTDYPTPDGTCVRDYIHVVDLAEAHLRALSAITPGKGLCLNLGTGQGHSVREVIKVCSEVTGCLVNVVEGSRRAGDPAILVASAALAQSRLGWKPRLGSLYEIVETAWKWHRSHPHGFDDRR
ncbi:MAG: UDP-glucose 4-epimerase GalE [Planctomycetia bacterium]|nr:UDP-glucose 4-epimerase GalE [Planctomycetia bacterium]